MTKSSLAEIRREAGFTIEEASKELGIPMGYLSHIENGKRSITSERAHKIADLYKKDVSEIFLASRYSVRAE